jgi:hypothetical protein
MPPFLLSKNRKLRLKLTPLQQNADEASAILADVAAGSGTITVLNINKFAVNKILLIGELGSEQSEIIKTHASTPPSGSTVTLASNTIYAHKAGTRVYIIQYDQVEFSHSTTLTGSKTNLTTTLGSGLVALEADEVDQVYNETEFTSGYYFARFKESIGGTFGGFCDAVPYGGFDEKSVGAVIEYALVNSNVVEFNNKITPLWCYTEINDMLRFFQGKQKRWNKYQNLNAIIGQTSRGIRQVAMPSDIYDAFSNRSLTSVRIGEDLALRFKDPDEFEQLLYGEKHNTVSTQALAGDTTLTLTNAYDFPDSGTVSVFISGTQYDITYTSITRATGVLNGIPASGVGAITVTIPAATNVWANFQQGEPWAYTVRNSLIEYFPIPNELWANKNVYADYWTEADAVNSDGDTLDMERFDMAKYWLTWKMRMNDKSEGKLDYEDGDYKMFADRLKDSIIFKGPLMKYKMKPKVNGISYAGYGRTRRRSGNTYNP